MPVLPVSNLGRGSRAPFRIGPLGQPTNVDPGTLHPEDALRLPWTANAQFSWLDYRNWIEVVLDPGMVLHKALPQQAQTPDQLGSVPMDSPTIDQATGGVPLTGTGVLDVIQRMATSTYFFVMRGWGLRAGFQVPIPRLVKVGSALVTPMAPHRAYNVIVGNFSGIPLWLGQWELPYMIASSPSTTLSPGLGGGPQVTQAPVPFNPALRIRPDAQLPKDGIRLPRTQTDQRAVSTSSFRTIPGSGFFGRVR